MKSIALAIACLLLAGCASNPPHELSASEELQIHQYKGKAYMERNNPQVALPSLRKVQELEPDNVDNLVLLGTAYYQLERPSQALVTLEQALALRPGKGEIHNRLGVVFMRVKRYQDAEQQFQLALQDARFLTPEESYFNLATLRREQGNIPAMLEMLNKALAIRPNHGPTHLELAQYHHQQRQWDQEQEHLNAILSLDHNNVRILQALARSYHLSEDRWRRDAMIKKIRELEPDSEETEKAIQGLLKNGK